MIEHKVQVGMFVPQIFKSVCTSEQSDQTSHFLPIDRPSKSDQTAWMGTYVDLYLLLYTGSDNNSGHRPRYGCACDARIFRKQFDVVLLIHVSFCVEKRQIVQGNER